MAADLEQAVGGEHASNLGALLARDLARAAGIPAFTVDPPVVDELDDASRLSGMAGFDQDAAWHALSQKSAAKHFADSRNLEYEDLNLIVAHIGGGVSVGAHRKGRCVKVRNALFDGPMSANRGGTLPGKAMLDLCFSGATREELVRRLVTSGGLVSYLGTDDLREVERRIDDGDARAALVFDAMAEQLAAEVASMVPKFRDERVHRIILTGGMCHSARLRRHLQQNLRNLGIKLTFYPGEREMEGLRDGALRVLRGIEQPRRYEPRG
jgi:butyrate kinase